MNVNFNENPKISKMSVLAFILTICGYLLLLIGLVFHKSLAILTALAPLIIIVCTVISTISSIIDLSKKNRKKWLSIVTLSLCILYIFVLIIGIIFMVGAAPRA
jgi:hypothetical protein